MIKYSKYALIDFGRQRTKYSIDAIITILKFNIFHHCNITLEKLLIFYLPKKILNDCYTYCIYFLKIQREAGL